MAKGILLGILLQCISAVGYLVIVNVTSIKSELFRTGLMICFASVVALVVTGYLAFPINGWPCTSPIHQKRFRPGCQ